MIIAILFSAALSQHPDNAFLQFIYNVSPGQLVPYRLTVLSYLLISMGTITGCRKVIRTLGNGLTGTTPPKRFRSEIYGSSTLISTALPGIPVSTTHTVTAAIIGTGLTRGVISAKWHTAKNIVWTWVLTIPATIIISGLLFQLMIPPGAPSI